MECPRAGVFDYNWPTKLHLEVAMARRTALALTLALVALFASRAGVAADLERVLGVQGTMETTAGTPANGSFSVVLVLYDAATGGTARYTQPAQQVDVSGGVFDATLGPLPDGLLVQYPALWLEAVVGGDALPRQPLRSVAYALLAQRSNVAGLAEDLDCVTCVKSAEVDFKWARAGTKGGLPDDLECTGACVSATELESGAVSNVHIQTGVITDDKLAFGYAGSPDKGGAAWDVACSGCVDGDDVAPSVALKGTVTVDGSLQACKLDGTGCAVKVSDSALVNKNDGWLAMQVPDGIRVRDLAGTSPRPIEFGGGTSAGSLAVSGGDLTVTGKVGVGTTSPSAALHVNGSWLLGASGVYPGFGVSGWASSSAGNLYEGGGAGWAHHFVSTGTGDIARFGTSGGVGQVPSTKVVITNGGKLGIGVASPAAALEVGGAGDIRATTLRLGSGADDDLTASDVAALTGGGDTTLHTHPKEEPKTLTRAFKAQGTTDACHAGSGDTYTTIPEMSIAFSLSEESVVLTELDINVVGCNGCWVAVRLVVDGVVDPKWTHVQPEGGGDEDDHIHLFRIDQLGVGAHTVEAQWGHGSGTMCNAAGTAPYWTRRMSAVAIPVSTGVKWGYTNGLTSQCKSAGGYTDIPDLALNMNLTEPSVVLTEMDINWVGCNGCWTAGRLVVDGSADPRWTHTQPEGGGDEDDHVHLFRLDTLGAGAHSVKAQWGDGGGTMCNHPASAPYWTRRIGYIAIPTSIGAKAYYVNPPTTACKAAGGYTTIPDLSIDADVSFLGWNVALTHFDMNWVGCNGCWMAARLATDGIPDSGWIHTQPEGGGDEDDHIHLHRVDFVGPGTHQFQAQWGDGSGTMCNNAGSAAYWSRRLGTLLLPAASP